MKRLHYMRKQYQTCKLKVNGMSSTNIMTPVLACMLDTNET
jgi:hypothetical protein